MESRKNLILEVESCMVMIYGPISASTHKRGEKEKKEKICVLVQPKGCCFHSIVFPVMRSHITAPLEEKRAFLIMFYLTERAFRILDSSINSHFCPFYVFHNFLLDKSHFKIVTEIQTAKRLLC
jgi:hypothetical protein